MIALILLSLACIYLLCGVIFAIPFVLVGVGKIDPHAAHGSWGFRILILPGTTLLWPLLAKRWRQGIHEPPEEKNAHRCAAAGCRTSNSTQDSI
jgi:hypothetical protein